MENNILIKREIVRIVVGISVIATHVAAFFGVVIFRQDYIPANERLDVAMVLIPVSAAYFMAVVRTAIRRQNVVISDEKVNLNYVIVVIFGTLCFCAMLLYFVYKYPDVGGPTTVELKRWLVVIEIGFGGAFGLIAEDLFGKIERINIKEKE